MALIKIFFKLLVLPLIAVVTLIQWRSSRQSYSICLQG
jgi:hypothetical protein